MNLEALTCATAILWYFYKSIITRVRLPICGTTRQDWECQGDCCAMVLDWRCIRVSGFCLVRTWTVVGSLVPRFKQPNLSSGWSHGPCASRHKLHDWQRAPLRVIKTKLNIKKYLDIVKVFFSRKKSCLYWSNVILSTWWTQIHFRWLIKI
jgi:hypothetical protein